jgi:hypothetical protein
MEEEREKLQILDSFDVLDYIRQSVEILMNMKVDEFDNFIKNKQLHEKI